MWGRCLERDCQLLAQPQRWRLSQPELVCPAERHVFEGKRPGNICQSATGD